MPRAETPHIIASPLNADRFHRDASYQNWRPLGTPDWLLILTVSGSGCVGTNAPRFSTSPGDVILFEPQTPQTYGTDSAADHWHLLWAHFYPRPHWTSWLRWPAREKGFLVTSIKDPDTLRQVRSSLTDCVRFNRQHLPSSPDLASNALERALIWTQSASQSGGLDERIRRASNILAEEIDRPLLLSDLAQRCGLSLSRFAHLFRAEMGISPQLYLEKIRLERAAQMLRSTSLSIGEIATESGYTSAFYFSNRFKKAFHQSPSLYRAAHS
ncbi:arabinose operon transcriptional regulator AraC [soil metagenome]